METIIVNFSKGVCVLNELVIVKSSDVVPDTIYVFADYDGVTLPHALFYNCLFSFNVKLW